MSDQAEDEGIPFVLRTNTQHAQQGFRMVELPPELLNIIEEGKDKIYFKSRVVPSPDNSYKVGHAVLCTKDKSYAVQQINTSNTIYLVKPGQTKVKDVTVSSMETYTTLNFSYDLKAITDESAVADLKVALPIYTSTGTYTAGDLKTKEQHFNVVPTSRVAFDRAWKELACFELEDSKGSFRPSAAVRVEVWSNMLTHALAEGIDITQPLQPDQVARLLTINEHVPQQIARAIAFAVTDDEENVDQEACLHFVGSSLLEEQSRATSSVSRVAFLRAWADAVPEKWRGTVSIELLKDICTVSKDNKTLTFNDR